MTSTTADRRAGNAVTNGIDSVPLATASYCDAIIIGAGFSGLRMIDEFRKLGLSVKALEAGSDVGGTWYYNRYPGARTDSESWVYILNISQQLKNNWRWKERFPQQSEVLGYLNHVADEFDMRKDIQFNTRVLSAHYDETNNLWNFLTDKGNKLSARYFLSATGVLSIQRELPFTGIERFKGEWYQTSTWPKHKVDFTAKRVAVVGTGATAVQVIPVIAHTASSVTVFQRTPNYVLPARNYPLADERLQEIRTNYDEIWEEARNQVFGMSMTDSRVKMSELHTDARIQQVLDRGWERGGFRFVFETFADITTSQQANDTAAEYIRNKIRAIVHDKEVAELLCPDYPLFAKRPPLGHDYFETFNRPNVKLVDVANNPIQEITESGLRTSTEEHDFDVIIFAIGFDAGTGAIEKMDIRGRSNESLADRWNDRLETYLGITVEDYPNMFMLTGPQSPFANLPVVVDNSANWIGSVISYMQRNGYTRMEPTKEASESWCKLLDDVYHATILPDGAKKAGSWLIGANVPGKPVRSLFWLGGAPMYFQICREESDNNFPSLRMM